MYFDSHAHLTEDCFAQDFDSIVENMKAASVTGMMEIGFDLPSSEKAVRLAERFSWVHAAVGSHPDDAAQVDEARIAVYRELCKNPRVKAIGEIGLDYHYEDPPRDVQQRAFRLQMALAQELSMPVVIHERKAHEDGLRIIDEFPDVKGVFHCFSGSYEMAKELIKRGWCIGFTGVVTFKMRTRPWRARRTSRWTASSSRPTAPTWPRSPSAAAAATRVWCRTWQKRSRTSAASPPKKSPAQPNPTPAGYSASDRHFRQREPLGSPGRGAWGDEKAARLGCFWGYLLGISPTPFRM